MQLWFSDMGVFMHVGAQGFELTLTCSLPLSASPQVADFIHSLPGCVEQAKQFREEVSTGEIMATGL